MSSIGIITASTRASRVGDKVASWVTSVLSPLAKDTPHSLVSIDLNTFALPIWDEPAAPALVPAKASYIHQHTIAWSTEISKHSAFVFVIPEYNFGVAAATKNAVDYLYHEWTGKPILIVSYGIFGGANANGQLKDILTGMKTKVVETRPQLPFTGGPTGEDLFAAFQGSLGDKTRDDWNAQKKADVVKGFEELVKALEEKKKEEEKKE